MKYALYKYSTRNIGDEIQSIAARQFIPKIDYYIDRDKVGSWTSKSVNQKVKLIANGWYMHNPMEWPLQDESLDILPVSVHIHDSDPAVKDVFSTKKSVKFLQKFNEVGARDKSTKKFLESIGVDSYFSSCLTLTLQRDMSITNKGFILCVTTSDEVYEAVKRSTDRTVIRIDTTTFDDQLSTEDRFSLAEQFLYLYQSAQLVITTRLHAALPCLALETPVIYITDSGAARYDPSRLDGLKELANNTLEKDFLESVENIDFDNPPKNPGAYKKYRDDMTSRCERFTGHKKANTFAVLNNFADFNLESSIMLKTLILNYDVNTQRVRDGMYGYARQLEHEVQELSKTRIALRKVAGNVKRKIKRGN